MALLYLSAGEHLVLVASKGGMSHHPAWYHNMTANPDVEVQRDPGDDPLAVLSHFRC